MRNIPAGHRRAGLGYGWLFRANFTREPAIQEEPSEHHIAPKDTRAIKRQPEGTELLFGWGKETATLKQRCRGARPGWRCPSAQLRMVFWILLGPCRDTVWSRGA